MYHYRWDQFDTDIKKIAEWAKAKQFIALYGIPRGGLVVAVALSHALALPMRLRVEEIDKATLVVDDIADSGETLQKLDGHLGRKAAVATIFAQKNSARMPDFWVCEKTDWIIFPWETEATSRYDDTFKSEIF